MLAALIVVSILALLMIGSLFIFLVLSNRKNARILRNLNPENYQAINRLSENLEKLPILDSRVENLSNTLNSQSAFLPKMETKIDTLEQKAATQSSVELLKENLAKLHDLTNRLDKEANTIKNNTTHYASEQRDKLSEVTNHLGKITTLDTNIATNLGVALNQTKIIPTLDSKVDTIKQHTNDINAIKEKLSNIGQLVDNLNQMTTTLSTESKNNNEENLRQLMAVHKEINDLNKIFINDRNRGHSGEKILEDFLGNYFGPKGATRLWAPQYKVTNINKPNQEIGLVDAIIFTPYENQNIAIDAKFPTLDYKKIFDGEGRVNLIYQKEFETKIKNKVKDLKKYIHADNGIASVIMFLPSENIYYFIANKCSEIMDYAYKEKIWLAGPTILMAILSSQHQVIQSYHFNKNIDRIKNLVLSLKAEFVRFDERATKLKTIYDRFVKETDIGFKNLRTTQDKINSRVERLESLDEEGSSPDLILETKPQSALVSEM